VALPLADSLPPRRCGPQLPGRAEALAIGRSTDSARICRRLRALHRVLAPYAHDPAVRELRAQVTDTA
jgi:hypothetical protein